MKVSFSFAALLMAVSLSSQAALITSPAAPALSGATVIDFESSVNGYYSSLTIGPVEFSTDTYMEVTSTYVGEYNSRGLHYLSNTNNGDQNIGTSLKFTFDIPTRAFGFNWGAADSDWTLNAYDASGNLIESQLVPPTYESNAGDFFGISVGTDIRYATLQTTANSDWVFIDNVTVAPVPEPESYALVLAGLTLMTAVSRRRKNRV